MVGFGIISRSRSVVISNVRVFIYSNWFTRDEAYLSVMAILPHPPHFDRATVYSLDGNMLNRKNTHQCRNTAEPQR